MLCIVSLSAKHCYQYRYELSLLVLVKRAQEDVCFDGLKSIRYKWLISCYLPGICLYAGRLQQQLLPDRCSLLPSGGSCVLIPCLSMLR